LNIVIFIELPTSLLYDLVQTIRKENPVPKNKITDTQRQEMIKLLTESSLTPAEIAEQVGVGKTSVIAENTKKNIRDYRGGNSSWVAGGKTFLTNRKQH
jgi:hypothetical protein